MSRRLAGFRIDDRAERLFLELARAQALPTLRHRRRLVAERIVVAVVGVGIFGELRVASGRAQAFEIRAARRHRRVIVGRPMELSDRRGAYVGVADERCGAPSIEGNVGREGGARIPHLLEPL